MGTKTPKKMKGIKIYSFGENASGLQIRALAPELGILTSALERKKWRLTSESDDLILMVYTVKCMY